MQTLALVKDLMDKSKIQARLSEAVFVKDEVELLAQNTELQPELIILNLDDVLASAKENTEEILCQLKKGTSKLISYSRHTNTQAIDIAKKAGVPKVLSRSVFFKQLPNLELVEL